MDIKPVVLEGDRAKLQPMEVHHVPELFNAGNHPDIWLYMPMNIQSMVDMKEFVNNLLQEK